MSDSLYRSTIPAKGEGKRGESGHIGYLLRQAAGAHRQRIERELAPLGLTAAQFTVLTMLRAYPGASGADIARVSLLTPQTMSAIVANLEKSGLVERRRHEVHGRILRIGLSSQGETALRRARERVHRLDAAVMEGLGVEETEIVKRWLVRTAEG